MSEKDIKKELDNKFKNIKEPLKTNIIKKIIDNLNKNKEKIKKYTEK